jgi:TetR/AcrR family transcriptional regulator, regulator of biofilm formation and stress response
MIPGVPNAPSRRGGSRSARARTPRGPSDPDRPERIADAALALLARRGIAGVSHRSVAAEAGVPLGSTTYHFKTLDDILIAALEKAIPENRADIDAWAASLGESPDLASELTDFVIRQAEEYEGRTIVEYELYLAALRRPALQALSLEWSRVLTRALERFVDAQTADALSAVFDGILMRVLASGHRLDRAEVESVFRRVAGT